MITFQPASAEGKSKGASGQIQPDGRFELTTLKPGDGAVPGKYKVIVVVKPKYTGPAFSIPVKYTSASTTPLEATVEKGKTYDFVLTKS